MRILYVFLWFAFVPLGSKFSMGNFSWLKLEEGKYFSLEGKLWGFQVFFFKRNNFSLAIKKNEIVFDQTCPKNKPIKFSSLLA